MLYQFINGFWFTLPCLEGTLKFLKIFKPFPTDIILASFPKTGTSRTTCMALIFLWHFMGKSQMSSVKPWTIEEAVDRFCDGVVPYGPYYDHVLRFQEESLERLKKVFFVSYEELKSDTKNQVKRSAEFLGCPFDKEEEAEEIVKICVPDTEAARDYKSSDFPIWFATPYNSFSRQGEVGDHENYLNSQLVQQMNIITKDKFQGGGYMSGV